ncbi:RING/U-box superfamily protein isoform 1 [Hibiscus syriacus]|uniref:RING/U-box superfamily protein isoform 1 n=1 Tax=Hibiscus syriacus TaxID=106335 RepID=A0A6A2ZHR0_HIBSY|nr:RING/U-box superfamily protein isoform 1 [Hibiscus syriacus]
MKIPDDAARDSLVTFFTGLSNNNARFDPNICWNSSSDPCRDKWKGIACDNKTNSLVKKTVLDNSSLSGVLNVAAICNVGSIAASLNLLNLSLNNIGGEIQADIVKCKQLTRLFLGGNQFTGKLPNSMSTLAQNNQLTWEIPEFDFSNLNQFNVSNNNFQGPIPDVSQKFPADCYLNDPGLLTRKKVKRVEAPAPSPNKVASVDDFVDTKPSFTSAELKTDVSKSEFPINSTESEMVSSSLVVLTSPTVSDLRVIFENGMVLAVKRIKGWMVSNDEFNQRMLRLDQAKHPNVLPPLAFYCSKHEKLLVYEYQLNGSLFTLLHEGLAFMHHELHGDGIHHGNLKSSDIMLKSNMEPFLSEYGLMVMDPQEPSSMQQQTKDTATSGFKADIYGLGVVLLELLTGKLVQDDGVDLTSWVHSVAPESRPSINQVATMINAIKEEEDKSSVHEP